MGMTTRSVAAVAILMVVILGAAGSGAADSTYEQCTNTMTAMMGCLPFATGKAAKPTPQCCAVVNSTVQHNKECLCKFIALVHQGSPEISSLGIQEAKLILLPSACNLNNVSASNCPHLAPSSSPVAAINNGTAANESAGAGYKMDQLVSLKGVALVAMAAFVFLFPEGLPFV